MDFIIGEQGMLNFIDMYRRAGDEEKAKELEEYLAESKKSKNLMKDIPDGFFTYNPVTEEVEFHGGIQ